MRSTLAALALLAGCTPAPSPTRPPVESPPPAATPADAVTVVLPAASASTPPAEGASATPTASAGAPPPKQKGVCSVPVFLAQECAGTEGVYQVEGYVVDAHRCPPCPRGAMCKPCDGDSIVLSDQRNPSDRRVVQGGNVLVRGQGTTKLQMGQRVTVKVRFDQIAFLGDPCCTPGPYFVDLVP